MSDLAGLADFSATFAEGITAASAWQTDLNINWFAIAGVSTVANWITTQAVAAGLVPEYSKWPTADIAAAIAAIQYAPAVSQLLANLSAVGAGSVDGTAQLSSIAETVDLPFPKK